MVIIVYDRNGNEIKRFPHMPDNLTTEEIEKRLGVPRNRFVTEKES